MTIYVNRAGALITKAECLALIADPDYSFLDFDDFFGGQTEVSTSWTGRVDGHVSADARPQVFQTTVRVQAAAAGDADEVSQHYWSSEVEAFAGHDELCRPFRSREDAAAQAAADDIEPSLANGYL